MQKTTFKPLLPHAIAIVVFLLVAVVYCKDAFQHKTLSPQDTDGWKAMSHNSYQYKDANGHFPLWTENLFSGMPGYQVAMDAPSFSPQYIAFDILTLWLPKPASFFFLACICFYFLTLALRLNPYVGMVTALAYAYSTYNPSILVVGHETKMQAIAIMPAFLASLIWLFEKKYWLGTATLALFSALFIAANHPQIVYYGLITAAFMFIAYLTRWIRAKDYRHIALVAALGAIGGGIGVACNAVVNLTTIDYAKASLRDGSELAKPGGSVTRTGLSTDYALSYSNYKSEVLTLIVPKIYGGGNFDARMTSDDSKSVTALQSMPPELGRQLQGYLRSYWGGITTTAGPAYAGAVICLLALMGFFLLDGKHKWWMLSAGILTILMSWGEYFKDFNVLLLDILPAYNKFRAPSVIIVVPTLLLCILAALTLDLLYTLPFAGRAVAWKQYKKGLYLTGAVFALLLFFYLSFDYSAASDSSLAQRVSALPAQLQQYIRGFLSAIREDRQGMFFDSLVRSFIYIALAATVAGLWIKGRLKPVLSLGIIGALALIDLLSLDTQYLNSDKYVDQEESDTPFQPTPADLQVMADKGYFRVFDIREGLDNITNDASTPYFHHSVTGYHPAKLSLYQDLIENQLMKFPDCQPVLNMLNTKYILLPGSTGRADSAVLNPNALGPVWFVRSVITAPTPRSVMDALSTLNTKDTAIVFSADQSATPPVTNTSPTTKDSISLIHNDNDEMTYHSISSSPRFAVFSEVYYNRGWLAYIDNKETPIIRTNFVLRGLSLPAGQHDIRFTFHPSAYYTGRTIQIIAGILLYLLLMVAAFYTFPLKTNPAVKPKTT
jgi:Bacterial membrane protein YfhO